MIIGSIEVDLYLGDIFSLKEKRQIVKSIIDKMRNRFNAAVAEVDRQDDHRWAVIAVVCVANLTSHVDRQLDCILDFMEKDGRFTVERINRELF